MLFCANFCDVTVTAKENLNNKLSKQLDSSILVRVEVFGIAVLYRELSTIFGCNILIIGAG